jgi:hypothetical protein
MRDARVLPECQQGTMEESTWADSMDSVCEGGAECACSDRTDANVEHGEQRNVHAHLALLRTCLSCGLWSVDFWL